MAQVTYYYLLMTQNDLLENESIEEILREKTTYYYNQKKHKNFWILISPDLLYKKKIEIESTNYYKNIKGNGKSFFASIISLDKEFINWLQLRLGYFEDIEKNVSLSSNEKYKSNGIKGKIILSTKINLNPLKYNKNILDLNFVAKKTTKFLDLYYEKIIKEKI